MVYARCESSRRHASPAIGDKRVSDQRSDTGFRDRMRWAATRLLRDADANQGRRGRACAFAQKQQWRRDWWISIEPAVCGLLLDRRQSSSVLTSPDTGEVLAIAGPTQRLDLNDSCWANPIVRRAPTAAIPWSPMNSHALRAGAKSKGIVSTASRTREMGDSSPAEGCEQASATSARFSARGRMASGAVALECSAASGRARVRRGRSSADVLGLLRSAFRRDPLSCPCLLFWPASLKLVVQRLEQVVVADRRQPFERASSSPWPSYGVNPMGTASVRCSFAGKYRPFGLEP
jgi:hypothetical protein